MYAYLKLLLGLIRIQAHLSVGLRLGEIYRVGNLSMVT